MRSFWRQRVPNSGVLMGFKEVHFPGPLLMYHKGRYDTILGRAGESEIVTLEIIFCVLLTPSRAPTKTTCD